MKDYRKKLVKLTFKDMEPISGIMIDYNDDWMLLQSNPNHYTIDGYVIVKNQNIKAIERAHDEKWKEKIIKLRKLPGKKINIPLTTLEKILKTLTKRFGVFTLLTKEEDVCWLGQLHAIDDKSLTIDYLTPKAKWDGQMTFKIKEIRAIEFDNDYINALKLIAKPGPTKPNKQKKKPVVALRK